MGNSGESCKAAVFQPHPLHIQCHRSPFHHNYHQHPLPYDASATVMNLSLTLRIVVTDVPVMALTFRRDKPFFSSPISLAYCSRIFSSDFLYELGLPIFTPSSLHLAMYCALPLLIRSMIVRRSICAISKRMVQMSEVTGLTLSSSVRVSSLI